MFLVQTFTKPYSFFKLCIYFWQWWVFVAARGLSLVAVSEGDSWLWTTGSRVLGLQQLRHIGSVAATHSLSCSRACEVFPDWGSNLSPQHCQGDSQPPYHQGSPSGCLSSVLLLYLLAVQGFLCQALYLSPEGFTVSGGAAQEGALLAGVGGGGRSRQLQPSVIKAVCVGERAFFHPTFMIPPSPTNIA